MNTNNNLNEAVDDRLKKANDAFRKIRKSAITNKNINITKNNAIRIANIKYIIQSAPNPHEQN